MIVSGLPGEFNGDFELNGNGYLKFLDGKSTRGVQIMMVNSGLPGEFNGVFHEVEMVILSFLMASLHVVSKLWWLIVDYLVNLMVIFNEVEMAILMASLHVVSFPIRGQINGKAPAMSCASWGCPCSWIVLLIPPPSVPLGCWVLDEHDLTSDRSDSGEQWLVLTDGNGKTH